MIAQKFDELSILTTVAIKNKFYKDKPILSCLNLKYRKLWLLTMDEYYIYLSIYL